MKKLLSLTLAITFVVIANGQTENHVAKFDASSTGVDCINLFEDGDGNVGIGTTTPVALLHLNQNNFLTTSPTNDYLKITETALSGSLPDLTSTAYTKFVVRGNGKIGVGTNNPYGQVTIQTHNWPDPADATYTGMVCPFFIQDDNGMPLAATFNVGENGGESGATFAVYGKSDQPALGVITDPVGDIKFPFFVKGDGTVIGF